MTRFVNCLGLAAMLAAGASDAAARPLHPQGPAFADPSRVRALDVNRILLHVGSDGTLGTTQDYLSSGAEYPRGSGAGMIVAGGLWFGGRTASGIRLAVATYGTDFEPGRVSGVGGDSAGVVWKVSPWRGSPADTAHVERATPRPGEDALIHHGWGEYVWYAAAAGAPTRMWRLPVTSTTDPTDSVDVVGPDLPGDLALWCVFHDTDAGLPRVFAPGTPPTGIEVERIVFGFAGDGPEGDVAFVRERIHNLSGVALQDVRAAFFADQDLCLAQDDVVASDSTQGWAYAYSSGRDAVCGAPPVLGVTMRGQMAGGAVGFAFRRVAKGLEPTEPGSAWNLLGGVDFGGSPLRTPAGDATHWDVADDPVRADGWLDSLRTDSRICVSHQHGDLAPAASFDLSYAIAGGMASYQAEALELVKCSLRAADAAAVAGFARPLPTVICARPPQNTPLDRAMWSDLLHQPPAGLDRGQLAQAIDDSSTSIDWPAPERVARLLETIDAVSSPRDLARAQFVSFLTNRIVLRGLGTQQEFLGSTPISIPGIPARFVSELEAPGAIRRTVFDARFEDAPNSAHRRPLDGIPSGLESFSGGAGVARTLTGAGFDPVAEPDSFGTVRLVNDPARAGRAYRYLRLELADGSEPPGGRGYRFAGYRPTTWFATDSLTGAPLAIAFVERARVDASGSLLARAQQPATFDSTWAPDTSGSGGYEYLFVTGRREEGQAIPALATDGAPWNPGPWRYVLSARLRTPFDTFDPGDGFAWRWGVSPTLGADGFLAEIDRTYAPGDTAAITRWNALAAELIRIQPAPQLVIPEAPLDGEAAAAGLGIPFGTSNGLSPYLRAWRLANVTDAGGVTTRWRTAARWPLALERSVDLGAYERVAVATPDADGYVSLTDSAPRYSHMNEYRIAFGVSGPTAGGFSITPQIPTRPAVAGLRPNPALGAAAVEFTLTSGNRATLELFDIAGRRVWRREVGSLGPGPHRVVLPAGTIHPGVVFVRLVQDGVEARGKGLILR